MTRPKPPQPPRKFMIWLFWLLFLAIMVGIFNRIIHKQFNPNTSPYSAQKGSVTEVILKRNHQHSYVVTGAINGQRATMLLDTGATTVTVPQHMAETFKLKPLGSHWAKTAAGNIQVFSTRIDTLSIGRITLHHIEATINPHDQSSYILLGMSALKHLNWQQSGNQLKLQYTR